MDVVTRRSALALAGAVGAGALLRYTGAGSGAASAAPGAAACMLTPSLEIGPFFVDAKLHRSDLTAGSTNPDVITAVPLALAIAVQRYSAGGCTPLAGAHVDLWHADAGGRYSDEASENTAGQTYLRGYQTTDANGRVAFTTIFPGWYPGRTVHIHAMIRTFSRSGAQAFAYTTQLFFDPSVTLDVMAAAKYGERGRPDTTNAADRIYAASGGATRVALAKSARGYRGAITIGVTA